MGVRQDLIKANKKANKKAKAEKAKRLEAEKKLKRAKKKGRPGEVRFVKWAEGSPAATAILVVAILVIGFVAWLFRERGAKITLLLLAAAVLTFIGTKAVQALADKRNHK